MEDAARAQRTAGERRVGAYYAACMDAAGIESRGIAPLRDVLARIDAIRSGVEAVDVGGELLAHRVSTFFDAYVEPDPGNAARTILAIDRSALGLDKDDYTRADAAPLRAAYRAHLVAIFDALGSLDAAGEADRVVSFESSLARAALSPVEERDPNAQDHPMSVADLAARNPAIAWSALFARLGVATPDRLNVAAPAWFDALNAALAGRDLEAARSFLRARVARAFAATLPRAIDEAVIDFDQRTLRGAREIAPRWRRCLSLVDRDVGDEVGRIFLARHFPDEARRRARAMVDALVATFDRRLTTIDWLGPAARAAARAKLANLLVVVGGSNRMKSYDGLELRADDAFGDAWRTRAFDVGWDLAQLRAPTDRQRFFDVLPQELDGFSAPAFVAIGFTAGFLQPPVFDASIDDAIDFGDLGGVIGHELTHELDDEGRKFDEHGNLRPWWSPEDVAAYESRARCFVDEYARFHAEEGSPVDGALTLGENLADNGGLRLAYEAARPSEVGPPIDGFTPAQRFFLAWGQIRCENVTPRAERKQVKTDGHSPGRWRVDGVVANMPEFAHTFGCKAGAPMAPSTRCSLW